MSIYSGNKKTAALSSSFLHKSDAFDFLNLGRLALTITQIVQLGAANFTVADQFNVIHTGRVDRESTFNTNAIGYTANSESFTDAAVAFGNNSAFESLQTFTVAFNNLHPDSDGVTDVDLRQIAADLFLLPS